MDFPKSVPGVGLVNGKFVDEDPLAATPGSLIPSAWGNAVTLEVLNVIQSAGLIPSEASNTQLEEAIDKKVTGAVKQATEEDLGGVKIATQSQVIAGTDDAASITPKKLAAAQQVQALTAFAAGGAAPAFTLTPTPAISAYAPNQRFQVSFSAAGGAAPTLNVSGRGVKNLKQYNSTGAKVAAVIGAGQTSDIFYDGTDWVLLDQLPTNGLVVGSGGWLSTAPVITGRLDALSGSQLGSAISGSTVDFPPQNANSVVSHMTFANGAFSADIAVGINNVAGQLLFRGNGPTAGLGVWYETYHTGNFTPSSKISGDRCGTAGFAGGGNVITDPYMQHLNGTVVYLATVAASFGIGQSWQDVKAARAANTNYTNTTARMIQVSITSGDASARSLIVNGVVAAYTSTTYGGNYFVTAMIPPGGTYSYTGSFSNWSEFR